MKKLFRVYRSIGGKVVYGTSRFDNKVVAKEVRDALGGVAEGYHVCRGEDNIPSPTGVPRMRRQPKG